MLGPNYQVLRYHVVIKFPILGSLVRILNGKMVNGSILLAPQMRHILASLDSVASAA